MSGPVRPAFEFGPFRLDPHERTLSQDGKRVPLTPKAFDLLLYIVESHGRLVTKEELLSHVWASTFVEEAVLSVNMSAIRKALGCGRTGHTYIETVPRQGYRFVAPVTTLESGGVADEADAVRALLGPAPDRIAGAGGSRARLGWTAAAAAVAIGLAAVFLARDFRPAAPASRSIAVLPLHSLSTQDEQEQFASAMTELLITSLGRIPALKVVSRQSVLQYKGSEKSLPEIARELGVEYVLAGTVAREGGRVRITAQLVHASTDRHLWSRSYERDLRGAFALQNEVAESIAREIGVTVSRTAPPVRAAGDVPVEGYEAYLRGAYFLDSGDPAAAIGELRRAVAIAPAFAAAWARIAIAWFDLAYFGMRSPRQAYSAMKEAALKALEQDDSLAEAHAALALVKMHYDWDWAGSERQFRRSLELNPSDSNVRHLYAHFLLTVGRPGDSLAEMDRAFEIDPIGLSTAT